VRAQYKILNKIESKSNKNRDSSNARADDNFRKIMASDRLTWIQYCFPNITRPGTGHEKARTSCNVKNRELPRYARQQLRRDFFYLLVNGFDLKKQQVGRSENFWEKNIVTTTT
jgi:hypothetical protein